MPDTSVAPKVFDRDLVARHLRRRPAGHDDFVTQLVLADLEERLGAVSRDFEQAIILSPDASVLPIAGRSASGAFRFERAATVLPLEGVPLVDPELLDLPQRGYDLIVSLFDLDVVDDVPGFLARARAHLRPDGLFMAAFVGGDSLTELREAFLTADAQVSGGAFLRVAPFIPLQAAAGLLQRAGLALPVSDVETHVVRYQSPLSLMRELKALGASNPLADRPHKLATMKLIGAAAAAYEALAGDADGRVRATLELVWMSGWAPHESQQKPLKPGSAKISLADALGTKN
ncbi:MAG: SAM-dependent methyltransferase [Hyphomicrobiales bacterium]|nr:MAG: SAM-dependent methyltransferase [Hyphomicrobiales bacterium]